MLTKTVEAPTDPPGPQFFLPGQFLFHMNQDRSGFLERMARQYGDVVQFSVGRQKIVLLSHPDLVKQVLTADYRLFHKSRALERAKNLLGNGLLTSEDEFHQRQRRLIQPTFHRIRVQGYGRTMGEYARRWSDNWTAGETRDIHTDMMKLTLNIAGKTLLDADMESEASEIRSALAAGVNGYQMMFLPFQELLDHLPLPHVRRFRQGKAKLDAIVYRIIQEHRNAGDRGDLLSMLLMAQDTEGEGGGMTDLQVRDEVMTIFLAGHETTANAMTWTWYLLSQNPEAEARLHEELDRELGDRSPEPEDLSKLPYTRQVFAESMRLYPPAWTVARRALQPYEVGGWRFPARTVFITSQWIVHRDARFYEEPLQFRPERWTPEAEASRPRFAYFPFAAGTRVCIGESFAWMEGHMLLATLARRWRLRLDPSQVVVPQPLITLRPKYGMRMKLEAR